MNIKSIFGVLGTMAISINANAVGVMTLPNGFDLYNTGIELISDVDQHYTIDGGVAYLNSAVYLSANNSDSAWLGPDSTSGVDAAKKPYDLSTTIDLTGIDVAAFRLSGFWVSDNFGVDILVNGNSTGQTNTGAHGSLPGDSPDNAFLIKGADGLIDGMNTIIFRWGNGPAYGGASTFPDPTHVRVEFAQYNIVPVPPAVWLFGSGLIGLTGLARQKTS